jgi:hypothetical protein
MQACREPVPRRPHVLIGSAQSGVCDVTLRVRASAGLVGSTVTTVSY